MTTTENFNLITPICCQVCISSLTFLGSFPSALYSAKGITFTCAPVSNLTFTVCESSITRLTNTVKVKGGMALRNGIWNGMRNDMRNDCGMAKRINFETFSSFCSFYSFTAQWTLFPRK